MLIWLTSKKVINYVNISSSFVEVVTFDSLLLSFIIESIRKINVSS